MVRGIGKIRFCRFKAFLHFRCPFLGFWPIFLSPNENRPEGRLIKTSLVAGIEFRAVRGTLLSAYAVPSSSGVGRPPLERLRLGFTSAGRVRPPPFPFIIPSEPCGGDNFLPLEGAFPWVVACYPHRGASFHAPLADSQTA